MTKTKPIKASVGFKDAGDVVARANAVLGGLFTAKDDYAVPPIAEATLKVQTDALSAAMAAALDGGKKAIAERNRQKEVVIKSLRLLAHYAQENCKDDMTTFLKSGFQAVTINRTSAQPLSEWIRKIVPGKNSGQFLVSLVARSDAWAYQVRCAPVGPGGTPGTWIDEPVVNTKRPALVTGLTPGTTYAIQVRAITNSGYTDWTESITRICT